MVKPPIDELIAMRLEASATFAEAGDWAAAAEELVTAWQLAPMTRVAELAGACDARAPIEGVTAKKVTDREAAWLALAEQLDEANLKKLLATPWPVHPNTAMERIQWLEMYPANPRISQALVGLHVRRHYASAVGRRVSRRIFRLLFAQQDPVVAEYLARLDHDNLADRTYGIGTLGSLVKKKPPPIRQPTARDAAALARLAAVTTSPTAATDQQSREELLAAIYAAPFDDGPREVLADLLVELGDPHGEYIALQLRRARGETTTKTLTRERALQRTAGKTWNRELEADGAFDVEFARGFPVRAKTHHVKFDAPAWATIEELALLSPTNFAMRDVPNLRGLRILHGVPRGMLETVELPVPEQLDELVVEGNVGLARPTALAPRVLGIDHVPHTQLPAMAEKIATWPVGRRVVELNVAAFINELALAFEILAVSRLETVMLTGSTNRNFLAGHQRWWARASRDRLTLGWIGEGYHASLEIERIATVLRALTARPIVTTVELLATGKAAARSLPKAAAAVASCIAKWPRAPKLVVNGA